MRLLQLTTGPDELLDLHPNVTIVTGLDHRSRGALVEAVAGLAQLEAAPTTGLLEAHGVLFDLDPALLGVLDLASPGVDPIVQAGQLPTSPISVDAQELQRREQHFEGVLDQVSRHVAAQAEARAEVETTAQELEAATEELRRVRALVAALDEADPEPGAGSRPAGEPDASPPPAEGYEPGGVDARLDEIERLLTVLAPLDRGPIADAVASLQHSDPTATVPSSEAMALAEELDGVEAELAASPAALREVGEGELAEAKTRLDEARQVLLEAEHAVRNPELDRAAVIQLEEAHEALIEAIEHAEGRFAGARARQRVVELRAAEQVVLDQLGFISYSDYMMGYSVLYADPATEAALEQARAALAEAEEHWTGLEAAAQTGLARAAMLDRRRSLREQAARMLDGAVGDGPAQVALRALRRPAPALQEAEDHLRAALTEAGLDVGDEDLDREDLSVMAEAWLEEADQLEARRSALLEERSDLQARREVLQATPAPLPEEAPPIEPGGAGAGPGRAHPAEAQAAATAAASRHAAAIARLEEEDRAVEALDAQGRVAAAEVERLQDLVAGQAPDEPSPAEALEWYLLARLAAQRMVSVAGSTPLLLDDALRGLEAAEVEHMLGRLESMAEAVQVIVISEDPVVAEWAEAAGPVRAAVVRPVAAPAL